MRPLMNVAIGVATIVPGRIADAEPKVVIVETADAPPLPALATQVQTYAGQAIAVSTIKHETTSLAFTAEASRVVEQQDASIVVWVAAVVAGDPSRDQVFLVYAAGRWPGRALIELVRIDARTAPGDVERTIALKISGLLDAMTAPRATGKALGVPTQPEPRAWRVGVIGAVVREAGDRRWDGRLVLAIDRAWSIGAWTVSLGSGMHWQPGNTIVGDAGYVSVQELGLDANVDVERDLGTWTFFARTHASAVLLLARGTSVLGPTGSATVFSPTIGIDVGVRLPVSDTVQLGAALVSDAAMIHQQFLVDGMPTADLRRGQIGVGVGLWLTL